MSFHNLLFQIWDESLKAPPPEIEKKQGDVNKPIHRCMHCDKVYQKANTLLMHMQKHTGSVRPKLIFFKPYLKNTVIKISKIQEDNLEKLVLLENLLDQNRVTFVVKATSICHPPLILTT